MSTTLKHWLAAFVTAVLAIVTTPSLADETITYIHWDALGSPVAATDESGNVVWRESYRPYGERIDNDPSADANSRWYTGHPQDADTGLVYAGARYYDPAVGRFLGIDPVEFQEDDPHSFNRYAYVSNNPYGYIDPDGRAKVADAWRSRGSGGSGFGAIENWGGGGLAGRIGATNPRTGGTGARNTEGASSAPPVSKGIPRPDGGFSADLTKSNSRSRSGHRNAGNKQLHEEMRDNPQLRTDMERRFGRDVVDRTSTSGAGRRNPRGAEWDHSSTNPNRLDLRTRPNHRLKTRAEGRHGGGWKRFHRD